MITKHTLHVTFTVLFILFSFKLALAAIPPTLNYQGHLTDSSGVPIDGPVDMVFAIYDIEVGSSALWRDSQSVKVKQGVFSVELGGGENPFPPGLFERPLWMGLTVAADAEMTPRRPISSVGFSFKAGDADRLEGTSAATLDQSAHVIDNANPHEVTTALIGAVSNADLTAHEGNSSVHHIKTSTFPELSGQIADAQIPPLIARDTEIMSTVLANDGPGSTLNADLLDGFTAGAFMAVSADNWVNTTGDVMSGPLILPTDGLTAGGTQLRLSGGNVGIGTSTPATKLEVRGDVSILNNVTSGGDSVGISSRGDAFASGTGFGYGGVFNGQGGSTAGVAYGTRNFASAYGSSEAYGVWSMATLGTTTGREYAFYGTGDGYFSGNVGIGTTSPIAKLDIAATGNGAEILRLSTEREWSFRQFGTGPNTHLELASIGGGNKNFLINTTGNVGIGTTSPAANLDIAGTAMVSGNLTVNGKIGGTARGIEIYRGIVACNSEGVITLQTTCTTVLCAPLFFRDCNGLCSEGVVRICPLPLAGYLVAP